MHPILCVLFMKRFLEPPRCLINVEGVWQIGAFAFHLFMSPNVSAEGTGEPSAGRQYPQAHGWQSSCFRQSTSAGAFLYDSP